MRIKNLSEDTIAGPVKWRVTGLTSGLGTPEIVGAENGVSGIGAILDLASILPEGGLAPGDYSGEKEVTFRLSDVQPLGSGRDYEGGIVSVVGRIFGKKR